jgi:hypothetical protein
MPRDRHGIVSPASKGIVDRRLFFKSRFRSAFSTNHSRAICRERIACGFRPFPRLAGPAFDAAPALTTIERL